MHLDTSALRKGFGPENIDFLPGLEYVDLPVHRGARIDTPLTPAGRRLHLKATIAAATLFGLQAAAAAAPSGRLWGLHLFGFLPGYGLAAALTLLAAAIVANRLVDPAPLMVRLSRPFERAPFASLCALGVVLAGCAVLFRTALPILGDGYTVLNNFRNTLGGAHPLGTSHEPLAMGYFYGLARILGVAWDLPPADAILAAEVPLLLAFVVCAGFTVRELFPEEGDGRRMPALLFVLSLPYLQLFFGYVEVYAVVLAALSITMLGVVLHRRGKLPFPFLPPLFALQVVVHYLGMLLGPLLLVVALREWKSSGWRPVALGFALAAPVVLVIFLWLGFDRILPPAPHSHILPLSEITDTYTAYLLFSPAHLAEYANLLFLLGAGPFVALILGGWGPATPADRALPVTLATAGLPVLIFAFVAKFDLGTAKDWDVTAPYFYPLALLGALTLLSKGAGATRAMLVIAAGVVVSTAAFIGVNADREASIRRARTLMEPSILPRGGFYQASIHLSTAYLEAGQVDSMVALWREFIARYPDDARGYQKLAKSMWEYGESGHEGILEVFELWKARVPRDPDVDRQHAQFCVFSGVAAMEKGRLAEARARFARALRITPGFAAALFQTGVSYLRGGEPDSALPWLREAAAASPRDVRVLESVVAAYVMLGDSAGALKAHENAVRIGSRMPRDFLNRRAVR